MPIPTCERFGLKGSRAAKWACVDRQGCLGSDPGLIGARDRAGRSAIYPRQDFLRSVLHKNGAMGRDPLTVQVEREGSHALLAAAAPLSHLPHLAWH